MSESPAGARLNFAMRGDVRASPIEFSWGSQTVTSVTGALPLRGHLAGVAEHFALCAPQADREAGQSGR
jgi:hypothetical protein